MTWTHNGFFVQNFMEDPVSDVELALFLHCVEDEPVAVWWVGGAKDRVDFALRAVDLDNGAAREALRRGARVE